ncbi:hypothetical protein Q7P35_002305 [Cladosporium inversicolor]
MPSENGLARYRYTSNAKTQTNKIRRAPFIGVNISVGAAMGFHIFKVFGARLQYLFEYFESFKYFWAARLTATMVCLGIIVKKGHLVEGVDELV